MSGYRSVGIGLELEERMLSNSHHGKKEELMSKSNENIPSINLIVAGLNLSQEERSNIFANATSDVLWTKYGILVDVETLGDKSNSVVMSLSAVVFPLNILDKGLDELLGKEFPRTFNINLDITEQLNKGRILTESTMEFWLKDNVEQFKDILNNKGESLSGLSEYLSWIEAVKKLTKARIYHRGTDFDAPIIESLLDTADLAVEWKRGGAVRDVRTYIDACMGTNTGFVIGLNNLHSSHKSLNDCLNDIRSMQVAYAYRNNLL